MSVVLARARSSHVALLALGALALAGCQRGCLASWLDEHGVGGVGGAGGPRAASTASAALPLHGIDCPDGLARCNAGTIEVSRLAAIAATCTGRPGECECPWEMSATCPPPGACVADGLILDVSPERARVQLCAAGAGEVVARPPSGPQRISRACEGDEGGHVCVGSTVAACAGAPPDGPDGGDGSPRPVAVCVMGCAREGEQLDEIVTDAQAVALLCRRARVD